MSQRQTPLNDRKKKALHFIVESNDSGRYVAGLLRRPKTDWNGTPTPLTKTDVDNMLKMIDRSKWALTNAAAYIEALYNFVPKEDV
jgi:hypothetical protein